MTRLLLKTVLMLLILFGLGKWALAASSMDLSQEQIDSVNRISAYMNSFTTLTGEFVQTGPSGKASKGTMFLSKPGKLRFDYAAPNPFLLVSDGRWVTFKNRAKEKGDQFPLSTTPLRFVVSKEIDLLRDANVVGFEQTDGIASVIFEERSSAFGGQLMLIFDENQNQLLQWVIIDGKGRRTTVELANLVAGVEIDPQLFVVKINRKEKKSR